MQFIETTLSGAMLIRLDRHQDERGFFARSFCADEAAARGLDPRVAQCNISVNAHRHTLRGMHYQEAPYGEAKLVRCVRGAIYDVIVDLRPASPTRYRWYAATLDDQNLDALYVPESFAHGFLTLTDDTMVLYQMSTAYHGPAARGVRWDDPKLAIEWPHAPSVISERDAAYPTLMEQSQ
jgi:dTDP-4-dehydrorhamnose 3,5-epimerase